MYVWWPGLDDEIENSVRLCRSCQATPAPAPLNPWRWPSRPWSRLHVDFAGLFMGKTLLIAYDFEFCLPCLEFQRPWCQTMGLVLLVRNSRPSSREMENQANHVSSIPSRRLAERALQIVKKGPQEGNRGQLGDRVRYYSSIELLLIARRASRLRSCCWVVDREVVWIC